MGVAPRTSDSQRILINGFVVATVKTVDAEHVALSE